MITLNQSIAKYHLRFSNEFFTNEILTFDFVKFGWIIAHNIAQDAVYAMSKLVATFQILLVRCDGIVCHYERLGEIPNRKGFRVFP